MLQFWENAVVPMSNAAREARIGVFVEFLVGVVCILVVAQQW